MAITQRRSTAARRLRRWTLAVLLVTGILVLGTNQRLLDLVFGTYD